MEAVAIPVLLSAAAKLFTELDTMRTLKKHNAAVVSAIQEFTQSLEADLRLVETRRKILQDDQSWAIESLSKDLEDARIRLEECRSKGWIQGYWDAKRTRNELSALQKKLAHNFQVKLFFTSLEVIIGKEKRTKDFHSKLVQLSTLAATRSDIKHSTNEIKDLLKPLGTELKVHEMRFQQLRAEIRALSAPLESQNLDTDKFLEDILACLAEPGPSFNGSEDDIQYNDPFTYELMFDPVKCNDGKTYDRFSVFKYNAESFNKPLVILCPDESVRIRLFDRFRLEQPGKIMRSRRNEYRTEALAIADAEEFGEALVRLENVLQWDPDDSECLHKRDKMRDLYRKQALSVAGNGNRKEALDMLQTVQKWSPSDREVFDKLEMIQRQDSASSDRSFQPQPHTHKTVNTTLKDTDGIVTISTKPGEATVFMENDNDLVRAFERLIALEGDRRPAIATGFTKEEEARKLTEYLEGIRTMRKSFEEVLWAYIADYFKLAKERPHTLLRALRVIDMQEILDLQPAANAKGMGSMAFLVAHRKSALHPFGEVQSQSPPSSDGRRYQDRCYVEICKAVEKRFDNLISNLVMEEDLKAALEEANVISMELPDIYAYVEPCFPLRYDISRLLVKLYAEKFVRMLWKLGDRANNLHNIEILKVTGWVVRFQEQLMNLGVDKAVASVCMESGAMDSLLTAYVDRMKVAMHKCYTDLLEADRREPPKKTEDGKLWTPAAVDFFRILAEQVQVVLDNNAHIMISRVALVVIQVMGDFQVAQRRRLEGPVADIGLDPLCALVNDNIRCYDLASELSNKVIEALTPYYAEQLNFEDRCKGFLEIAKEAAQKTMSLIFEDPGVKDLLAKLYLIEWYEGQVTEDLVLTFEDYFTDVKLFIEDRSFRGFVEACLEETVVVYIDHFLKQSEHKLWITWDSLDKLRVDEENLREFFKKNISPEQVEERLQPLAGIRELAHSESVDEFTLRYTNLLQKHPDCPPEVVEKVVNLRENVPGKDAREVVAECREAFRLNSLKFRNGELPKAGSVFSRLTCLAKTALQQK